VFDDRQLITGLPGMIVRRADEPGNSTVMQGTSIYTDLGPCDQVKALHSVGVSLCVGLLCMIVCTRGTPNLSLYIERRLRCNSSPSRIQLRSSRSIIESNFSNIPTRSSLQLEVHATLVCILWSWPWTQVGPLERSWPDIEPYRSSIDRDDIKLTLEMME
jgi:hypothetical protein